MKIKSFLRKKTYLLILILILSISLFFRTYKVINRFNFDHDSDLYSWIVKDIVVNYHPRLIGQLTTAPGIFIGPIFYYFLVPFFLLFNMNPTGAIIPIVIIGVLTVFSYFVVFSKLFNTKVGLIGSFLYAVLIREVELDRRVVPTTPTGIWVVWYFYTVMMIARGNFYVLPLLGILIGLIWHIHIALLPTLIAIPIAFLVSKKWPSVKQLIQFFVALILTNIPLIIFEVKHNFGQTYALLGNFVTKREGTTGINKFIEVANMITKNVNTLMFQPQYFKVFDNIIFVLLIFLSAIFLIRKKLISKSELIVLYSWIFGVYAFFSLSSSPISEYYFFNLEVIFITIFSCFLYLLFKTSTTGRFLTIFILSVILIKNGYFYITQYYYHKGYLEKKLLVDVIKKDMLAKNYPCVGISYITSPGENVGFRYLFYLKNISLTHPSIEIPVYNIFIPEELSKDKDTQKFGHVGLVLPKEKYSLEELQKICSMGNTNLTDPLFGYVD